MPVSGQSHPIELTSSMTESFLRMITNRLTQRSPRPAVRLLLLTSVLFSWLACGTRGSAQEAENFSIGGLDPDLYTLTEPMEALQEGGFGMTFQAGHIAGQTLALQEPITHVEMMPYMFMEDGMAFGSARFFRSNTGDYGGSGGVGYRHYFSGYDRYFGASLWYDRDGSRTSIFEQTGLSFESIGEYFDLRTNLYYPIGTKERQLDLRLNPGSLRFQDYNLLFDQTRVVGEALKGLDMEAGIPIRQEWAMKHNARLYGGWYYYKSERTDDVIGWKLRTEATLVPSVKMDLSLLDDEVFGTSVNFGVSWTFDPHNSFRANPHKSVWDRMTQSVERNRAVVVSEQNLLEADQLAINPDTGNPYIFRHVNSAAAGVMDGTFENPFDLIQDAQFDTNYDIIYVHADSVFNGADSTIVTDAGKRMLGEADGVTHLITIPGFGTQAIPRATTGTNRPQLNTAPGDSLFLSSGSEFSGFVINAPVGNGVFMTGTNGGIMRNNLINNAGGRGILMNNTTGTFLFDSVNIAGAVGNGFEVNGGNPNLTYSNSIITNTSARALQIDGTTGGFINLSTSVIDDDGGQGILIQNTTGSVTVDTATIANSTTTGVDVNNTIGRVNFVGPLAIAGSADLPLTVTDVGAASAVTFNTVAITDRPDIPVANGINLERISGNVSFVGATNIGGTNGQPPFVFVDPFAINFQESTGNVAFSSINIQGNNTIYQDIPNNIIFAFDSGIHIGNTLTNNSGTFTVAGPTTIDGMPGIGILIEDDDSIVRFNGNVDINYSNFSDAIQVINNRGNVFFGGITDVQGGGRAISLFNNSGSTNFNIVNIDAGVIPTFTDPITGDVNSVNGALESFANTGAVTFQTLNIDVTGDAFRVVDNASFRVDQGGLINVVGPVGFIVNSDIGVTFSQILADSRNPTSDTGLLILNSTGDFLVDGLLGTSEFTNYLDDAVVLIENNDGDASIDANDLEVLSVELVDVLFEDNGSSVVALNIDEIRLDTLEVNNSNDEAVLAVNTRFFQLQNSTFVDNGTNDGLADGNVLEPVVDLLYTTTRDDDQIYEVYVLSNNLNNVGFDEDNDTILNIQAVNTVTRDSLFVGLSSFGIDSDSDLDREMDLFVEVTGGNVFTLANDDNLTDIAAINIEWNGQLDTIIGDGTTVDDRNLFNIGSLALDADMFVINIANDTNEVDETSNISIENNQIDVLTDTGNTTIFNFEIDAEANILINNNVTTTLSQTENIVNFGAVFDIGANSDVVISSNTFTLGPDAGVAVRFDRIAGPSRVNISNNVFNLNDLNIGGGLEQGVIFNSIFGTVTLSSTLDNTVNFNGIFNGTEIIFQAPAGTTNGAITLNGIDFP